MIKRIGFYWNQSRKIKHKVGDEVIITAEYWCRGLYGVIREKRGSRYSMEITGYREPLLTKSTREKITAAGGDLAKTNIGHSCGNLFKYPEQRGLYVDNSWICPMIGTAKTGELIQDWGVVKKAEEEKKEEEKKGE